jgi:citrate lyase subunit beta/citryl-CoA lyase
MHEDRVRRTIEGTAEHLGAEDMRIVAKDQGAPEWVVQARVEAAIIRFLPDLEILYSPEYEEENRYYVERDRSRRTRLYLPGNRPDAILGAGSHGPDGVVLDLGDDLPPDEKDVATLLVRNALCSVDFRGAERMVRIGRLPAGFEDLPFVIPFNVHTVLIPRCERAQDVRLTLDHISDIQEQHGMEMPIYVIPILESALGVVNAFEIASAAPEVAALAFGARDFRRDIKATATGDGRESATARGQIILAARAAGIQPLDAVYPREEDEEGLRARAGEAAGLGFDGIGCVDPRQIEIVHEVFGVPGKEK